MNDKDLLLSKFLVFYHFIDCLLFDCLMRRLVFVLSLLFHNPTHFTRKFRCDLMSRNLLLLNFLLVFHNIYVHNKNTTLSQLTKIKCIKARARNLRAKTHKKECLMRPAVSYVTAPACKICKFLNVLLSEVINRFFNLNTGLEILSSLSQK